jgi:hypothetical protein
MRTLFVVVLALFACGSALARDVYRCVDASGKVSFSDTSCPGSDSAAERTGGTTGRASPTGSSSAGTGSRSSPPSAQPQSAQPRGGYGGFIDRARSDMQKNNGTGAAPH